MDFFKNLKDYNLFDRIRITLQKSKYHLRSASRKSTVASQIFKYNRKRKLTKEELYKNFDPDKFHLN